MPNAEPHRLSAAALARLIEGGELTAEAVVRSCLDRIAEREPVVRAWAHLDPERRSTRRAPATAAAGAAAQGRAVRHQGHFRHRRHADRLRLADLYRLPAGLRRRARRRCRAPPARSCSARRSRPNSPTAIPARPRNPHNPMHTPGGSSSGSAAAVADFMVPLAIGTQTGGSVIRPAAYCGVVGFKPSYGLFPPAGMHPNTESLDTVGIMARSVEDIALFRAALMAIPYEPPRHAGAAAAPRPVPHAALGRGAAGGQGGAGSGRRAAARGRGARSSKPNCRPNATTSPRCSGATAPSRRCATMRRSCTGTRPC